MPNENNNLIPFRSTDEAREAGRKGGKASGVTRRKKKLFKQLMSTYLDSGESNTDNWNELAGDGFEPGEITNKAVIVKRLCDLAKTGDVQAVKLVMSMIGEDVQHEELLLKKKEIKMKEKAVAAKIPEIEQEEPMLYKALMEDDGNDVS